jgi:purine-binding chemotaxis protein CheW
MAKSKEKYKNVFLSFSVGPEQFAVSANSILEVVQNPNITEIPDVPGFIRGIINFRGDIIPVIDARVKLNMSHQISAELPVVIVFEHITTNNNSKIGVWVDRVHEVFSFQNSGITPVSEIGLHIDSEFIKGAINYNQKFLLVLDVEKFLSFNTVHPVDII